MKFYEMILFLIAFGGTILILDYLAGPHIKSFFRWWPGFGGLLIILMCAAACWFKRDEYEDDDGNGSLR